MPDGAANWKLSCSLTLVSVTVVEFAGVGVLVGDLDVRADGRARDVAELLQLADVLRTEGTRPRHDLAQRVLDRLPVDGGDLRAELNPGAVSRTTGQDVVDDHPPVVEFADRHTQTAVGRLVELVAKITLNRPTDVSVGDRPREIAQGVEVAVNVVVLIGALETRAEFRLERVPIDVLIVGESVLVAQLLDHSVERFGEAEVGVIDQCGALRLDQVDHRVAGAVKGERCRVHVDDRVPGGQAHQRIVVGEQLVISAEAVREILLIVGRVDDVFAAGDFPLLRGIVADAGRGVSARPTAAVQVTLLQVGVAEDIFPVGDGEDLHTLIGFAVVIHVAVGAVRHLRQRQAVADRRVVEVGGKLTDHLQFNRHQEIAVAIDKPGLIFEDDLRLRDSGGEQRIGIGERSGNRDRTAFVVDDRRGWDVGLSLDDPKTEQNAE